MATKKTTRARLVERAAAAKGIPPMAAGPRKRPAPSMASAKAPKAPGTRAPGAATLGVPGLEIDEIQETVRSVVTYVQQNPLAAAAVAIGVGVMLASMYWDSTANRPGKARAPR